MASQHVGQDMRMDQKQIAASHGVTPSVHSNTSLTAPGGKHASYATNSRRAHRIASLIKALLLHAHRHALVDGNCLCTTAPFRAVQ